MSDLGDRTGAYTPGEDDEPETPPAAVAPPADLSKIKLIPLVEREISDLRDESPAPPGYLLCVAISSVWQEKSQVCDQVSNVLSHQPQQGHVRYVDTFAPDQVAATYHEDGPCPHEPPLELLIPETHPEIRFTVHGHTFSRVIMGKELYSVVRLGSGPRDVSVPDVNIPRQRFLELSIEGGQLRMQPALTGPYLVEIQTLQGWTMLQTQGQDVPRQGRLRLVKRGAVGVEFAYELSEHTRGLATLPSPAECQQLLDRMRVFPRFRRLNLTFAGARKVALQYPSGAASVSAPGWTIWARGSGGVLGGSGSFHKFYCFGDAYAAEQVCDQLATEWDRANDALAQQNPRGVHLGTRPTIPRGADTETITKAEAMTQPPIYPIVHVSSPWMDTDIQPSINYRKKLAPLARSLDVLHEAGLVHGDLKPSNSAVDHLQNVVAIDCDSLRSLKDNRLVLRFTPGYAYPKVAAAPNVSDPRLMRANDRYGFLAIVLAWTIGAEQADEVFRSQADEAGDAGLAQYLERDLHWKPESVHALLAPLNENDEHFLERESSTCEKWLDRFNSTFDRPTNGTESEDSDEWLRVLYRAIVPLAPSQYEAAFDDTLRQLMKAESAAAERRARLISYLALTFVLLLVAVYVLATATR